MTTTGNRETHAALMALAFGGRQSPRAGSAPEYPEDFAALYGDENEATPDLLPDEPFLTGRVVRGSSVTCVPCEPSTALLQCVLPEAQSAEERVEQPRLEELWGAPVAAVSEWLEAFYEPLGAGDLAELTGASQLAVLAALECLHVAGKVARQRVGRSSYLWVWRRG